jgi:hypothetical protein
VGATAHSKSLVEAIDRLSGVFASTIDYQAIANGPVERVIAFNNNEQIRLEGPDDKPYFSSHGNLSDLQHREIPGTRIETTFPVDPTTFPDASQQPNPQVRPFDKPPRDPAHTLGNGYSKQAYFFNNDRDYVVTVGPSLPKIVTLDNGGAQFWVASIGVITQGHGEFEGARGMSVYIGSAYIENWPATFPEQVAILRAGFNALVGTYFKLVPREHVRP